ncbi:membrane protein [Neptunitalea chrysea]|uniref:Membrane protein n=1 Tax=Neptunitalea chrysea TaxID=1647581 RepID=A0A9W6B552_9FLAO|nr:RagB/SusD family nutrient uptake outer membrane protein [Neptunitalea chrysea]GLB52818.1 membrane protein [Neptunitalea chrysea]
MKIITKNIVFLFALLFIVSGCNEDFLDVDKMDEYEVADSETVTPEQMVNGVYGYLTDWTYAFSYLGVTEIISDNADKGSSSTDTGADKDVLDELTFTTSAGSILAVWQTWYKTIGRATIAINYTENYGLTDDSYKERLIGEAKFLRALHYFWLVRSFGAIPLQHIDYTERQPVAEVYAFIEQDLQDAIDALPVKSGYDADNLGRATKGAAQALLSKVYLYEENYQAAYDMANSVISSGEYSLESDYATLWRESTENGVESIFEVQARGEVVAHGVQQYSQTQGVRGQFGWGFNVPSQNLLDAFNDAGDDIRRDATIIFAGELMWDGTQIISNPENPMYNEKAYSSANGGSGDTDKNIRMIRYAEVLLIKAEAAVQLGLDAATPLNQVRSRVGLSDITSPDLQDVWNERRLELAFEHDRWFDLIRTGQAPSAMAADGKTFVTGKHELFPIPNNQLTQTPEMEQNPGW